MAFSPRPPMICPTAWEGVIASQYGLFCDSVNSHLDKLGNLYWTGGYKYTMSSAEWLKCAQDGCLWCRFLAKRFLGRLSISPQWPSDTTNVRVGRNRNQVWREEEVTIVVNGFGESFKLHTMEGNPAARYIKNRILISQVGKPYALDLAKTCIEECVHDHPECQAITAYPIGYAPLPTRLIDCSDPDCLRIVETDPVMRETYIALSYVWGEDQPHRTTEMNLSSYKLRINPTDLPQTILDAIHVTRALGIDLLWIDGLCIVQDSEKDVHLELARMRDVYRNAFLTIDASSAARVSEGFLQDRELESIPCAVLPFVCPLSEPIEQSADRAAHWQLGSVYVSEYDIGYCTESTGVEEDPHNNHTGSRGWCLQERLLSTRSLVFTYQTLQLQCQAKTRNIGGAHHYDFYDVARLPFAVFLPHRHVARHSYEWMHIYVQWQEIICDYTFRKLTNPEDKLTAISAAAEMFAPILGPEYVAGLWRPSLLKDLLWQSHDLHIPRTTEYRGPSWSWASTDSSVYWVCLLEHADSKFLAEVAKCTATLKSEQLPFGPVTAASLILRCPILPLKWGVDKDADGTPTRKLYIDHPLSSLFPLKEELTFNGDYPSLPEPGLEAWFAPLLNRGFPLVVNLVGLVVTRADIDVWRRKGTQVEGDVYRRVGMASREVRLDVGPWSNTDEERIEIRRIRAMMSQIPMLDIELV
ncbi:hypothetical protein ONZ51_g2647 [Trametes cubensis]|uniref:Heterokaryon incompatibility domain-containing protein n=1 Tax=Trametes cubensis TaxID=1111947 RepID=A0AAD7TZU8_9APHY|nr:hypothetical protein ONZ51_g2647 [Trametes cubensis]